MNPRSLLKMLMVLLAACPSRLPPQAAGAQEPDATTPKSISPAEVALYRGAKHVIEFSPEELRAAYPELANLRFDPDQDLLGPLLRKVGERVETMFRDLPNTASREDVHRDYRNLGFRQQGSTSQTFSYLFLARRPEEGKGWIEVRTDRNGKPVLDAQLRRGGFLTSGFAGLGYLLHPLQQSGSLYRHLGRDDSKTGALVIAFAQRAESADILGSLTLDGVAHPLLFQGLVWVDPQSYQIIRMRTGLLAPRTDLGLYRQDTEIWFTEVRFEDRNRSLWMPHEVLVTIEWKNGVFRNRHRYSDYRLFTVETFEKRELPTRGARPP